MIVCHCHAVGHRRVLEVIRDGARTPGEVMRACGAGRSCGGCTEAVCELIEMVEDESSPASSRVIEAPVSATL
jgi:bacterioferritin-associated ferredoxin